MTETKETHNPRVLIVEDDAFIALDIEYLMEAAQFRVVKTASRVGEALEFLERETPDVALLDFNLGDHTSIPVAKRLDRLGVPFMFVSGQTRDVVLSGLDRDDYTVIGKPFCPDHLVSEAYAVATA